MAEYIVNTSKLLVSKTDLDGTIIQANEAFCEVSGYAKDELIGSPHSLVRHHDMPSIVFKLLWVKLYDGQEVYAFVKNKRKNGDFYWVYATVTPQFDRNGKLISFTSVRKKINQTAVKQIEPIYRELRSLEKPSSYGQSAMRLREILTDKNSKYNKLISSMQMGASI